VLAAYTNTTTVTLGAGASALVDAYNGCIIDFVAGTGAGQSRLIIDYSVTTKVATLYPALITALDATTVYQISGGISDLVAIRDSGITGTPSQIAGAFTKFFDKASPTGTVNSLPDAVPGQANALPILGTNAAGMVLNGQVKIAANVAGEGALDIENTNVAGYGEMTDAPLYGQYNLGTGVGSYGQYNSGVAIGQRNVGSGALGAGQRNDGGATGQVNVGTAAYGIQAIGTLNETDIGLCDVWDCVLAAHLTPGSTGAALNTAVALGDPWAVILPAAYVAGQAGYQFYQILGCTCGTGSIPFTYTVTNSVSGLPVAGAYVWITTDLAGTNIIWAGYTDTFGVARNPGGGLPMLSAGNFYFWKSHLGLTDDQNPDTESVP
jgi:hypothetical protein